MAPPNGTQIFTSDPRRRMVQPVLPALPLLNKAKRIEVKGREGQASSRHAATNGIKLQGVSTNEHDTSISSNGAAERYTELILEESENSEEPASTTASIAYDTETSQESLQTEKPTVGPGIGQPKDAKSEQHESTVTLAGQIHDDPVAIEPTVIPQIDSTIAQFNGHKEDELDTSIPIHSSQGSAVPVADAVSPNHVLYEDRTHTHSLAHSILSPTAQSVVLQGAERSIKQHRRIETPSHAIPEAVTNGHASPIRSSNLHHHTLSVPSPARTPQIPTIHEHLLHLANSKQWADWVVEVHQPGLHLQPFLAYAHSFVLLRSEKIRKIMSRPQDPTFANNVIGLYPARTIQPHAFEAALRFLYSDTVLSAEALFPRDTYMDKHARAHVIDYTLSYWTAGIELGLEPVTTRAFNLLAGMVDWDIAELLTKEVMAIRASVPLATEIETPSESMIMADSILRQIFRLFTHHLDLAQFRLDAEAQTDLLVSRFAQFDYGRPTSNPVLASMVFGSMPSTGNHSPSTPHDATASFSADTVASIVLLNLDYSDLLAFAREMVSFHGEASSRIINEVIGERERRRLIIVNNRAISNKQRMANSGLWDNLGFREYMEDGNLRRERVGYLLSHKHH